MTTGSIPTALKTAASTLPSSLMVGAPLQNSSLAFNPLSSGNVDAVARFSSLGLAGDTTNLNVTLDLKAGQDYSFSFYYAKKGPKVWLTDSAGKKTNVTMAKGFKVARTGTYKLSFSAGYSLKAAGLDNLQITSRGNLPGSSGDKRIDALTYTGTGQWWRVRNAAIERSTERITPGATSLAPEASLHTLSYSFLKAPGAGQAMTGFQEMTDAQKAAVRSAFNYYSKILDLTFTEVADGAPANINVGTNAQSNSAAYATLPNSGSTPDQTFLYLANNAGTNSDVGVQEGGYGWMTILHEIGHTLGLKHPGNYNAGGGGTPGPYLSGSEDNRQFSIMSYNSNNASRGVNPTTAMAYDVAALQYLYGANTEGSTAVDGTFAFAAGKNYLQTLWSASGTDKIDLSQLTNSSDVNLNAGAYSSINIVGPANSSFYSGRNNVAIAYGAKINAVKLSAASGVAENVTLNSAFKAGSFNTVESFEAGHDRVALSKSVFGKLSTANIEFATTATKSSSRILVNKTTGEIFYDADGSRNRSAPVKVAQLAKSGGDLSLSNFTVVA